MFINYECKPLQWDTDYFGLSSARVDLKGIVDENDQNKILNFCLGYDFISISNRDNRKENNRWIGNRTNAILTDINVQFIKILTHRPNYQDGNTVLIKGLPRNEQIINIARNSFHNSRFFNDIYLPEEKSKNIYVHWTECAFGREDKYFIVSEREGNMAGYILFSLNDESSTIELIAVDGKYQGRGVGRSLIHTMEVFSFNQSINKIKVGTQLNNIAAVQFYSTMKFKYMQCSSIYHLWPRLS